MTFRPVRAVAPVLVLAVAACQGDSPTEAPYVEPSLSWNAGAAPTLLAPGFYFLPPTVGAPGPSFDGTFDPALEPVVEVCGLDGGDPASPSDCAEAPVVTLTMDGQPPEFVRVDEDDEAYLANWRVPRKLAVGESYRAFVRVGSTVLGHLDLVTVGRGGNPRSVPNGFAALRPGTPFLFKFRIETGIVGAVTVAPATAELFDADTPDQEATFTATVTDLHGLPLEGEDVDFILSSPALLAADPADGTTDENGEVTTTVTPVGTVEEETDVTLTARSQGREGSATVTVLPTPLQSPIAQPDVYSVLADQTLDVSAPGILRNDIDRDGEALTATVIVDNVDHGTLTATTDGAFTYEPDPGFTGTDEWSYRMRDASFNDSEPATVTIHVVEPSESGPVGADDFYQVMEGNTLDVPAPGILANDIDLDGEALTATVIVDGVDHGTLSATTDGAFTYEPDPGFTGTDEWSYRIRDASFNLSDPITVTIEVLVDPDKNPLGQPDRYAVIEGTTLSVSSPGFLANDVDPDGEALTATVITDDVDHGTLSATTDGAFTYDPDPGFTGTDQWSYRMRDASFNLSDPVTVTIDVLPASTTDPVAVADAYLTFETTTLEVPAPGILGNDLDPDGEALTATVIVDSPEHGSLSATTDGAFSYEPDAGFTGTDEWSYQMRDASFNLSDPVTVTIEVVADPDANPVGGPDGYLVIEETTLEVPAPGFLANDLDPDGEALTATVIVDSPEHGSLSATTDGAFSYEPDAGFTGTDEWSYQMRDASFNLSDPVTVTIEVLPDPNQAPLAFPDLFSVLEGETLAVTAPGFLLNDVDPDGEALTATVIVDSPEHGSLSATTDGAFTYEPDAGFTGIDQWSYRMRDASFNVSEPATVTIEVFEGTAPSMVAAGGPSAAPARIEVPEGGAAMKEVPSRATPVPAPAARPDADPLPVGGAPTLETPSVDRAPEPAASLGGDVLRVEEGARTGPGGAGPALDGAGDTIVPGRIGSEGGARLPVDPGGRSPPGS